MSHFSTRNPCSPRYLTPLEGLKVDCKSSAEMVFYMLCSCHCIAAQCQEAKAALIFSHLHARGKAGSALETGTDIPKSLGGSGSGLKLWPRLHFSCVVVYSPMSEPAGAQNRDDDNENLHPGKECSQPDSVRMFFQPWDVSPALICFKWWDDSWGRDFLTFIQPFSFPVLPHPMKIYVPVQVPLDSYLSHACRQFRHP